MKIRQGFVSNSSSSSFIVAINPKDKCTHCGRSSPDIVNVLESTQWYDDTKLEWTDPTEYIEELQQEIYSNQLDLEKYVGMNDDEKIIFNYGSSRDYVYTVKQLRQWANDVINNNEKTINDIKDYIKKGKKVVYFHVDYHEPTLNNMIREQIDNGELEVIYESS